MRFHEVAFGGPGQFDNGGQLLGGDRPLARAQVVGRAQLDLVRRLGRGLRSLFFLLAQVGCNGAKVKVKLLELWILNLETMEGP